MFNKKYNKNNSQSSIKRGNCVDKAPRLLFILILRRLPQILTRRKIAKHVIFSNVPEIMK